MNIISDSIQTKVGAGVSAITTATGLSTFLDIVNPLLGVIASSVGICLSIVFIINAIKKNRREERKLQLEEQEITRHNEKTNKTINELRREIEKLHDKDAR